MKNIKIVFLLCMFLAGVLYACNKNDTDEKWAKEEAELAEWIEINKPGLSIENRIYFEKVGAEYKTNIKPEPGDYILVDYECRFLFEDVLEQVSYKDWQARGALYPSPYREGGPELWESKYWESMGIGQLRENECANVYIPSRMLNFQDFKTRVFWVHLRKVIDTDLKTYQEKIMGSCMKNFGNDVDTITVTENGKDYYVIFHVDQEGTGGDISGTSVKTHINETYFLQADDPKDCFKNKDYTWNKYLEIFQSVKKGGHITAVMPYRLMYGDKADLIDGQCAVPVNTVLKYDITIDN